VFPFLCKLHEALGMHGHLIVEAERSSVKMP
jgi:plastocyanin